MDQPLDEHRRASFTVINTEGLHLRPAQAVAHASSSHTECEVIAIKDDTRVNAKSIMGLMELIGACGEQITFDVTGPGSDILLSELGQLFASGFDEQIDPRFASRPDSE